MTNNNNNKNNNDADKLIETQNINTFTSIKMHHINSKTNCQVDPILTVDLEPIKNQKRSIFHYQIHIHNKPFLFTGKSMLL
jgi:hypothetical protein